MTRQKWAGLECKTKQKQTYIQGADGVMRPGGHDVDIRGHTSKIEGAGEAHQRDEYSR